MIGRLAARRAGAASTASLVVVALLFGWFATHAEGEVVRKADLFDGGIWVTNSEQARFGRLNKVASQLDAGIAAPGTQSSGLDVVQDGAVVLGVDRSTNQLTPIAPTTATLAENQTVTLPTPPKPTPQVYAQPLVDARGASVAAVDPATGTVWAQRVDSRAGVSVLDRLQPQAKPVATVGAGAVVAVGADGTVYAASAAASVLVTIRPDAADGFAQPVQTPLGFTSRSIALTVVGQRWVVLDQATGTVHADGLRTPAPLVPAAEKPVYAALQQPGPDADAVLVQGVDGLRSVSLGSGAVSTPVTVPVQAGASGLLLSAPVRLGECVHAAWAGADSVWYGRSCAGGGQSAGQDGQPAVQLGALGRGVRTDGVKLRVNRGLIVLNDLDSGNLWDLDNKPVKVDNWDSVIPPPQTEDKNVKKDPNLTDDQVVKTPPEAQPDDLNVRAGRTSTLHVLDNDSDAEGSILGIAPGDVSQPDAADVTVSVSVDGQTVEVTVPERPSSTTVHFTYKVNNGGSGTTSSATGTVTVHVVDENVNTAPVLRGGQAKLAAGRYPVVKSGHVTVGVIADWRDGENDPLSVEALDSGVGVDPSGALGITAPGQPGPFPVKYQVTDGHGGGTPGEVAVTVLGDEDKAEPPLTQPDVLRAVVGKPVQLQPLGNDIPGADPTDPAARMRLAAAVRGPGQLSIDTNLDTSVLTVTGSAPGTFLLTYAAQVGSAVSSGRVRVDILPNPSDDQPPVAAPDSASVRDQEPVITDVLSNDYSPRSDVIVVQKVVSDVAWLQPSVVQGRWVRMQATSPLTDGTKQRQGSIAYTISDGTKTAVGHVSVVQKPRAATPLLPNVQDDEAVVRIGDVVTVPVLDNDTMSGGVPLKIDPAAVKVVSGKGQAFASGRVLRYVPDAAPITSDDVVTVEYAAYPEGGQDREVTGRVTITVKPLPTPTTPNQPPTARSFSASVTAGDTIVITVPTSGIDPDGDLTYVAGIVGQEGNAVNLRLGRVTSFGAATVKYQAYPRSSGTEVIRYVVRDRFGLTSEALIRVGVVQPGDPQPPVAVADDIVAAPGRTVTADVLGNDLIAPDDEVSYEDLSRLNDAGALAEFTHREDDTFQVVAPDEGPAKVLTYGITDGLFDPSRSTLTVRGQKDFNNPPLALDDTAKPEPGQASVLVDALANDTDVDGPQSSLSIVQVVGEGAVVEGRQVRITLLDHPRAVPYVITDADGAQAMALIYVPTADNGAPYVTVGKTVQMDQDSSVKVSLADYVTDPRGRTVKITSPDTVSTSPREHLAQAVTGDAEITLTSANGYVGPAALMLQVTDTTGEGDAAALTAYISIPVQVGPRVPVLRCPDYEVGLVADGPPRLVDIPRLCHAWMPDGLDPSTVRYTASWTTPISDVELTQQSTGGRVASLRARAAAPDGATGVLTVGVEGSPETFQVRVRVTGAQPLSIRAIRIDGLIAGTSQTVNVAQYLVSPLERPDCSVARVQVRNGAGVSGTASGCTVTVTAAKEARGDAVLIFEASDAPGRLAVGQIAVSIRGVPDPPVGIGAVADRIAGGTARVSWSPPTYDGGLPVLQYEVAASTGQRLVCPSAPCTISGLKNGVPVSFTVRARNAVDWSQPSAPSPQVIPDTAPRAVTVGVVTPGDRTLDVTWAAPANEGSAVDQYQVQWVNVNGGAGGGTRIVAGSALSTTLTGLVNDDQYSLRVQAHNGAGWGPYGPTVVKQSVGTPKSVGAPTLTPRTPTPSDDNGQVTISWNSTDPNGPPLTKYTVYRDGAPIATVSANAQRTASDTVPYDGRTHTYAVSATNGGGKESARPNTSSYRASGVPQRPAMGKVTTPNADYKGVASWNLGSSRSSSYSQVQWQTSAGDGGTISCSPTCSGATFSGLGTSSQTMQIRAKNDAGAWSPWSAASPSYHPYGPTKAVANLKSKISGSGGDYTITWTWDNVNNGRAYDRITVSGAKSATLSGSATSTSVSGIGYSQTKTLKVTATVDDNGAGSASDQDSATTPDRPNPTMKVTAGSACSGSSCDASAPGDCRTTCYFVVITTSNFQSGTATCVISGQTGGAFSTKTVDTNRRVQTSAFYGYGDTVSVTCRGNSTTESASDKQPNWGG